MSLLRVPSRVCLAILLGACGPSVDAGTGPHGPGGSDDAGTGGSDDADTSGGDSAFDSDGGSPRPDGGVAMSCSGLDLTGCACVMAGQARACYTGAPSTQHVGLCRDGTQTCVTSGEFAYWGPCTGSVGPSTEQCSDGQDHDCNGKIGCDDSACASMAGCCTQGQMRTCFDGPSGAVGVGPCKSGTQTCTAQGWPMACGGEVLPGAEAGNCHDGVDNDCNGLVDCKDPACMSDAGCQPMVCQPGAMQPCYDGKAGTASVGACRPGKQTCTNAGQWGTTCVGEVTPSNELGHCHDGVDNDCNGLTDCQDFACIFDSGCQPKVCTGGDTRACYDGPSGTSGKGACHGGTQTCKSDGSGWGACGGQVLPGVEGGQCSDGVDNDCNGLTDCADPACQSAMSCCSGTSGGVDGTIWANSSTDLYRVDPGTLAVTHIGAFGVADAITDLAVTPAGVLYGNSFTQLFTVSKTTAKATYVMDIGSGMTGMTFTSSGSLLVASSNGDLVRVDPVGKSVTTVGNYGSGFSSSGDLVAVASGALYGTSATGPGSSSSNVLLRVSPSTGVATGVGTIGFSTVWGLAYAGARVIGFTSTGEIIQIDPGTGQGVLMRSTGIAWYGAGMSPSVAANPCN